MNLKKSELFFMVLLVPLDAVMILLSFLLAYYIRNNETLYSVSYMIPMMSYLRILAIVIPGWLIIFALSKLYNIYHIRRAFDEEISVLIAVTAGVMLMVAVFFAERTLFFSRLVLLYSWLAAILFVSFGRLSVRLIRVYLYSKNIGVKKVIIIGSGTIAKKLIAELCRPFSGYRVIGIVNGEQAETLMGIKILGQTDQITKILSEHPIDEIIQADARLTDQVVSELLNYCNEKGVNFRFAPKLFEVLAVTNVEISTVAGVPIIEVKRSRLDGWGRIIKRLIDLIGSGICLIILSPVMLVIAIAIKINSKGPVLYYSKRVGKNEKPFRFYKFRSMYTEHCIGKEFGGKSAKEFYQQLQQKNQKDKILFEVKDDPRITSVGRFLRRTRLDEVASLFNVLLGDMSLVGPRPHIPEEVEKFQRRLRRRFIVKPGVTGLWQISGQHNLNTEDWIRLEIYYVENWSLALDAYIMLKTVGVIFRGSPRDQ